MASCKNDKLKNLESNAKDTYGNSSINSLCSCILEGRAESDPNYLLSSDDIGLLAQSLSPFSGSCFVVLILYS